MWCEQYSGRNEGEFYWMESIGIGGIGDIFQWMDILEFIPALKAHFHTMWFCIKHKSKKKKWYQVKLKQATTKKKRRYSLTFPSRERFFWRRKSKNVTILNWKCHWIPVSEKGSPFFHQWGADIARQHFMSIFRKLIICLAYTMIKNRYIAYLNWLDPFCQRNRRRREENI